MEPSQILEATDEYEASLGEPAANLTEWIDPMWEESLIAEVAYAIRDDLPVPYGSFKAHIKHMAEQYDNYEALGPQWDRLAGQFMLAVFKRLDQYRSAEG